MPDICSKSQYANTKWDGAEDPTINNFFKIDSRKIEYALLRAYRPKPTAVFYINRSRQKYYLATSVFGDSYCPPAETHAKWEK